MAKNNDPARVINDYKRWVERIQKRAEDKVEQAVVAITTNTNNAYSSLPADEASQLQQKPIYYKMYGGKSIITGAAIARPIKEFIYLEFGTRRTPQDQLTIASGFKSGIDTNSVAAPYKSNNPNFLNNKSSGGNYIFLGNIDLEGIKFLKNFWK